MSKREYVQNCGYNGYAGYSQYPCGFQRNRSCNRCFFGGYTAKAVTLSVTAVTGQIQRWLRYAVTRKASIHAGFSKFAMAVTAVTAKATWERNALSHGGRTNGLF